MALAKSRICTLLSANGGQGKACTMPPLALADDPKAG
jgi:hypothetical protein